MIKVAAEKIAVLVPIDEHRAELFEGWGLSRKDGALFAPDGRQPYCVKTKRAAKEVELSGLLPTAQFAHFKGK